MPRKERDEKRRDSKGRLLKSGESQRPDGRYAYKYIDTFGNPKFVYSWKLVPTDKMKLLSDDKLGAASIDSVKLSDAKEWALRMQEQGVAYNTICNSKRSRISFYVISQMRTHTILKSSSTISTSIAMLVVKHIQFAGVPMCHFLHHFPPLSHVLFFKID